MVWIIIGVVGVDDGKEVVLVGDNGKEENKGKEKIIKYILFWYSLIGFYYRFM